jgi:hypothetical protein
VETLLLETAVLVGVAKSLCGYDPEEMRIHFAQSQPVDDAVNLRMFLGPIQLLWADRYSGVESVGDLQLGVDVKVSVPPHDHVGPARLYRVLNPIDQKPYRASSTSHRPIEPRFVLSEHRISMARRPVIAQAACIEALEPCGPCNAAMPCIRPFLKVGLQRGNGATKE